MEKHDSVSCQSGNVQHNITQALQLHVEILICEGYLNYGLGITAILYTSTD